MGKKCKIDGLKYPSADNIKGRISTICRSMASTLIHRIPCSEDEENKWKEYFSSKECAYCGKHATHLDHLHPLIDNEKPTGYGTEVANLVPCCSECNQSKGNMEWEDFMKSGKCRHVGNSNFPDSVKAMEARIEAIKKFQTEMPPKKVEINDAMLEKWGNIMNGFRDMLDNALGELQEMKKELYKDDPPVGIVEKNDGGVNDVNDNCFCGVSGKTKSASTLQKALEMAKFYMTNETSFVKMDKKYFGIDNQNGTKTWTLLKRLGVKGEHRGLLMNSDIDSEILKASGALKDTLIKIKDANLL